jgi:hypothetical protein
MSAVTLGDLLARARSHLDAATGLAGTAREPPWTRAKRRRWQQRL